MVLGRNETGISTGGIKAVKPPGNSETVEWLHDLNFERLSRALAYSLK